jgi:hypothetical protein
MTIKQEDIDDVVKFLTPNENNEYFGIDRDEYCMVRLYNKTLTNLISEHAQMKADLIEIKNKISNPQGMSAFDLVKAREIASKYGDESNE